MHSMRITVPLYTTAMGSSRSPSITRNRVYGTDEEPMCQMDSIEGPEVAGKDERRWTGS